ncbi:hypothetical protein [Curtobacterium phage Parvaparticeps]|nr:hypothetical protein [Curtobacterium phage Parvaparticeps]
MKKILKAVLAMTASATLIATGLLITSTPAQAEGPLTYTYAGDSITNPSNSWSYTRFLGDPTLTSAGGVGISGATSTAVAAAVQPNNADVLVVMVGTNDVRFGTNPKVVRDNVKKIVATVNPKHVVVAAVAPSNLTNYGSAHINRAKQGVILNRTLSSSATNMGWLFVDPWDGVRQMDGTWANGRAQSDGVHPAVSTMSTPGDGVGVRFAKYMRVAVEGALQ